VKFRIEFGREIHSPHPDKKRERPLSRPLPMIVRMVGIPNQKLTLSMEPATNSFFEPLV
jgi:hypothetical protein